MKVKQVIELIESNGWRHVRTKGDHRIYVKDGERYTLSVPGKLSDEMPKGTQASILRKARLKG